MASVPAGYLRLARPALFAAIIAIVAACGSDNNGSTGPSDVSGNYALDSVSGHALPDTVPNSSSDIIITGATAVLSTDHTYTVQGQGSNDDGPGQVVADQGTYTLSGSTITFHSTIFDAVYTASATSSSFVATIPGAFVNSSNTSFSLNFVKAM